MKHAFARELLSVRLLTLMVFAVVVFAGIGCASQEATGRRVMTWVPPYAVEDCKERLDEAYDGVGLRHGITHLGLQFWNPTSDGGLKVVSRFKPINDGQIRAFREWGAKHNVRVMLCVYNITSTKWDWTLATAAFKTNRAKFIDTLVNETVRLKLDGIDIDFEGKGNQDESKASFVRFIRELSRRLKEKGKELTVDSFAYKWNAPNQRWWPELLPHVDGLHVMGYAETGASAEGWRSYKALKAAAGKHASKLILGVPSSVGKWQSAALETHLKWVADDPLVGLAIWDAQLRAPAWRQRATWQTIIKIKHGSRSR